MKLTLLGCLAALTSPVMGAWNKPVIGDVPRRTTFDSTVLRGLENQFFVDYGLEAQFSALYTAKEVQSMTDITRRDPYDNSKHRRLLLNIYNPVYEIDCFGMTNPVMEWETSEQWKRTFAAQGIDQKYITDYEMLSCTRGGWLKNKGGFYPVIILLPDYSLGRDLYAMQADNMARRGYVVYVFDNPGETTIAEFPNGQIVWGENYTYPVPEDEAAFHTDVRVQDVSWVLDQLQHPSDMDWEMPLSGDFNEIWVIGHGLGGSAAANLLLKDERISGAINYDGTIYGEAAEKGIKKPFMLVGRELSENETCPFGDFYDKIDAPKMHIRVKGTTHLAYTDVAQYMNHTNIRVIKTPMYEVPEKKDAYHKVFGYFGWHNMMVFLDEMHWRFAALMQKGKGPGKLEEIEPMFDMEVVRNNLKGQHRNDFITRNKSEEVTEPES